MLGPAGKCLGVEGAPASRERVVLDTCRDSLAGVAPDQLWELPPRGFAGEVKLGGLCLDVDQAQADDLTPIQLFPCHGGANQRWQHDSDGRLVGLAGRCLDLQGAGTADGTPAILFGCHGHDNQIFLAEPLEAWGPTDFRQSRVWGEVAGTSDPGIAYMTQGSASLLRSLDQGRSWSAVGPVADYLPLLTVDHASPDLLWRREDYDAIARSEDGGRSWRVIARLGTPLRLLEQSRLDPRRLLAVGENAIWASADRGLTFARIGDLPLAGGFLRPPYDLAENAAGEWLLLQLGGCGPFGSGCTGSVFRSADQGRSWVPSFSFQALAAKIASHPADPQRIYLLELGGELHRSDDGGVSFAPVGEVPTPEPSAEVVTQSEELAIAGDPRVAGRVWATRLGALWRSDDRGQSWVEVARDQMLGAGWGAFRLAFLDPATLLVVLGKDPGNDVSRTLISRDGGATFSVQGEGIHGGAIDGLAAAARPGRFYARGGSFSWGGLWRTDDHGRRWRELLPRSCASALVADPVEPDTVYVGGAQSCLQPSTPLLQRSRDGGETFEDISPLGPPESIGQLVAVRRNGATVLVAALTNNQGGVFRSPDGGTTWQTAIVADSRVVELWASGQGIFANVAGSIYFSSDGGARWSLLAGVPSPFAAGGGKYVSIAGDFLTVYGGVSGPVVSPRPGGLVGIPQIDVFGRLYYRLGDSLLRSVDDGRTWQALDAGLNGPAWDLTADPYDPARLLAATGNGPLIGRFADPNPLALGHGRFAVTVRWRDPQGQSGWGRAKALTSDSGAFWFFSPERTEVVVKVLDGRFFNGRFWVFVGSLTNVEFELEVVDRVGGERRVYRNPPDHFASFGDTSAFPLGEAQPASEPPKPDFYVSTRDTMLDLAGRFRLDVEFRNGATAVPAFGRVLSGDTAAFTFFSPENVELLINVIDGRALNGKFWVFAGSLSNVPYTLRVRDLETGAVKLYENPAGTFASFGDTDAF